MSNKRTVIKISDYETVSVKKEAAKQLKKIAGKNGLRNRKGEPSRSQAIEYLLKNFEQRID